MPDKVQIERWRRELDDLRKRAADSGQTNTYWHTRATEIEVALALVEVHDESEEE